ncbi:extracellular solute-binding protein [Embleya hyalina]|uniref:Sugar ABC transporter substrate-binding protein n=1 Tax=Embleya hyalina TaxID=516124 RepID=A0A401YT03_9ACTN|nr:extracellular solute-binding protein [Embleya hyalina]GCD97706.1 sugar ABC transporter substrate-binding protein [Embleya hyalina]
MTSGLRGLVAVVSTLVVLASVSGCSGGGGAAKGSGKLTVWLTVDAQESWPDLVRSVNARFEQAHPGTDVTVEYQQWTSKNLKLDAALAGHNVPDVVEMGNSETVNYIVNNAFAPVDPARFDHAGEWLGALREPCEYNGKVYCVPYYVGARVGISRTDLLQRVGVTKAPTTYPELIAGLDALKAKFGTEDRAFSALYMPGRYWYAALAFVKDAGGEIAVKKDGRWQSTLSGPRSVQGLQAWKDLIDAYYVGDRAKDNSDEPAVVGQGKVGIFYGNTWEADAATDSKSGGNPELKGRFASFAFPGPSGGPLPPFLGGSELAVPVKSKKQDLAQDWIRLFTDRTSQERLIKANTLPNNTAQLADVDADGVNGPAAKAATRGWVTPQAPGWAAVEKANILQEMLEDIATGKHSVKDATKAADGRIDAVINKN